MCIRDSSITVYSGATIAGHYRLALIHNANNEVGVWTWYEGEAGATGLTIYAELRVAFRPTDAPAPPVSSGGFTFTKVASATGFAANNNTRNFSAEDIVTLQAAMADTGVLGFLIARDRTSVSSGATVSCMIWKEPARDYSGSIFDMNGLLETTGQGNTAHVGLNKTQLKLWNQTGSTSAKPTVAIAASTVFNVFSFKIGS